MVLAVEYDLKPFRNDINQTFLIISVFLLGLLAGFRGPEVARDYESYQNIFDYIYDLAGKNDGVFLPVIEPGFAAIVLVFRSLSHTNYVLFTMIFFAFASVLLKIISIKKLTANPYLVILFYFSHYFLLHEMTQIRIGFASAFFFIGLIFYLRGNKWIYISLILFATLFHYSALMYLLILFFDSKKFNKPIYFAVLIGSIILGVLRIPFLNYLGSFDPATISGRLGNYANIVESGRAENINVFNVLYLLDLGTCFYFIFFIPVNNLLNDKSTLLFLKCNVLSIFLLSFLSGVPSFAFRFSELFGLLSMFMYATLVRYLPFDNKLNLLITILMAGVIFYITAFHGDLLHPYYITK